MTNKEEILKKLLKENTSKDGSGCGCKNCLTNLIKDTISLTEKAVKEDVLKKIDKSPIHYATKEQLKQKIKEMGK